MLIKIYNSISGYVGIVLIVATIFLIFPLFSISYTAHILLQISFLLILLFLTCMIKNTQTAIGATIFFIFPYIFFDAWSIYTGSINFMIYSYYFNCAFSLIISAYLISEILTSRFINTDMIFAAIAVYFITGIVLSKLYFVINTLYPLSFIGIKPLDAQAHTLLEAYESQFNFLYYSFTVLTSLGLGDITPVHHMAKSLTVLEAIFGQLFVATLIAKLVGSWR